MPKKIAKIISSAKHRLSGRTGSGAKIRPPGGKSGIGSDLERGDSKRSTTSDSARLLSDDDDNYDRTDGGAGGDHRPCLVATGDDYDDFESPDLNLASLSRSATGAGTKLEQSDCHQPQSGDLRCKASASSGAGDVGGGRPGVAQILKSLLFSFGRSDPAAAVAAETSADYDELYTEQKERHWWRSDFRLLDGDGSGGAALFGTWNGVFVTTVVHLFGVISFLRIGWLVGLEGVPLAMAIVLVCMLFNAVSLLAAIGIMERCAAAVAASSPLFGGGDGDSEYQTTAARARANVHILIATVLGSRVGGAISLVYCIGQAVSCALHVTGFSETFVHLWALIIEQGLQEEQQTPAAAAPGNHSSAVAAGFLWSWPLPSASMARAMARMLWIEIQSSAEAPGQFQLVLAPETFQLVSAILILLLFVSNIIGVRWLFRLQSLLFLALAAAVADFTVGLFGRHADFGFGELYASRQHLVANLAPAASTDARAWPFWRQLFETVGVFFPATIGVMAGVNMGADLERPTRSIPVGSLGAIVTSYGVHVLFIAGLALLCPRTALLKDYAIAQHVAAIGWFFSFGLYMSTISSGLGSMYTAPRIMQNLAQELHSVPGVRRFAQGKGPNNIPINALIFFTLVTLGCVLIGGINVLAPIVTIPYLLTYSAIEYAYFSMAMTFDIQIQREKRFMQIASQLQTSDSQFGDLGGPSPGTKMMMDDDDDGGAGQSAELVEVSSIAETRRDRTLNATPAATKRKPADDTVSLSLSVGGGNGVGTGVGNVSPSPSLQQQHLAGYGSIQSITQRIKIKRRQSTQSSSDDEDQRSSAQRPATDGSKSPAGKKKEPKTIKQLMAAVSNSDEDDDDEGELRSRQAPGFGVRLPAAVVHNQDAADQDDSQISMDLDGQKQQERLLMPDAELTEIACKQEVWYLRMMNRWIVLVAAILKLVLMFVIAWHYALITLAMFALFYFIIGRTNPGFYPGVSEFSLCKWFRACWSRIKSWRPDYYQKMGAGDPNHLVASYSYDRIVFPSAVIPDLHCDAIDQLTKQNSDYSERPQCHFTTTVNSQFN